MTAPASRRQPWHIRDVLMMLYAVIWSGVTVLMAWRGNEIVEGMAWWGGLAAGELAIWRIFAPPAPPEGGA